MNYRVIFILKLGQLCAEPWKGHEKFSFSLTELDSPLGQDAVVCNWPHDLLYAFLSSGLNNCHAVKAQQKGRQLLALRII